MRVDHKEIAIYEKGLPAQMSLPEKFAAARGLGFSAIEIAIDDDPNRVKRLDWDSQEIARLKAALFKEEFSIQSITLSAHRMKPLGESDSSVRLEAKAIGEKAIRLANALEVPIVQIAGYFSSSGDHSNASRDRFLEGLSHLTAQAQQADIMLALENVDGTDVISAKDGVALVQEIDSPALRLYVDVGNFVANGLDALQELQLAMPYACAIQLKDTRPGTYRRVEFGAGEVPFRKLIEECIVDFASLPLSLELWNDGEEIGPAERAISWFESLWSDISSYRWDQLQSDDHGHSH